MDLSTINNNIVKFTSKKPVQGGVQFGSGLQVNSPQLSVLKADAVSFGNTDLVASAETKMVSYIQNMLTEKGLKPDQPVKITVTQDYLPLAKLVYREALKMQSGPVVLDVVDPKFEEMKARYGAKEFNFVNQRDQEIKDKGGLFVEFVKNQSASINSYYKAAGLTNKEIAAVIDKDTVKLPEDVQKAMEAVVDPHETLDVKLSLLPGQPLRISAEREHQPLVHRLVEHALKKGAGPISIEYTEAGPNDPDRSYYEYASDKTLKTIPDWFVAKAHEYVDNNAAMLNLRGNNPTALEGLDTGKITDRDKLVKATIKFFRDSMSNSNIPWCVYYAPTTKSAIAAYPEFKTDKTAKTATPEEEINALRKAAQDAVKINRFGKGEEHIKNLTRVSDIVNNLGLKGIRFVSTDTMVDPVTGETKPKTNLYVGLTDKAIFKAALEHTVPLNDYPSQPFSANCPTEEVFSYPDKNETRGYVTATMPLNLNGNIVDGIYIEFDDKGKVKTFKAEKNEDVFKQTIEKHKGGDMLGEVALVAGSPIFDLGRLFMSTLLDENATCHIAVGSAYGDCVKGAGDIKDPTEKQKYLDANNANDSTTHIDFMIGGPNVVVKGVTQDGKEIDLIKDNKYVI